VRSCECRGTEGKGFNKMLEIAIYIAILVSAALFIYLISLGLGVQRALNRILSYIGDGPRPTAPIDKPPTNSSLVQDAEQHRSSRDDLASQQTSSQVSSHQANKHDEAQDPRFTAADAENLRTVREIAERFEGINEEADAKV